MIPEYSLDNALIVPKPTKVPREDYYLTVMKQPSMENVIIIHTVEVVDSTAIATMFLYDTVTGKRTPTRSMAVNGSLPKIFPYLIELESGDVDALQDMVVESQSNQTRNPRPRENRPV